MNNLLSLLPPGEHPDLQRASTILAERDRLLQSMRRQQRAQFLMRRWRTIHIVLACTALVIICLHIGIPSSPLCFPAYGCAEMKYVGHNKAAPTVCGHARV